MTKVSDPIHQPPLYPNQPMSTEIIPSNYEKFHHLIRTGIQAWIAAGQLLVEILKDNPNASQDLCAIYPDLTPAVLAKFEAIGRGTLNPRLLLGEGPGVRRLRGMPISVQNQFADNSVDLLVLTDGGSDTIKVAIKNLTRVQADQAFSRWGVRDLAAQRAWLEDQKTRASFSTLESNRPYKITGNKIRICAGVEMTREQMYEIWKTW